MVKSKGFGVVLAKAYRCKAQKQVNYRGNTNGKDANRSAYCIIEKNS